MLARWWVYLLAAFLALGLIGVLLAGFAALVTIPTLPSLEALTDYRPKIPLRVYSAEGLLIGEFGEERRRGGQDQLGPRAPETGDSGR